MRHRASLGASRRRAARPAPPDLHRRGSSPRAARRAHTSRRAGSETGLALQPRQHGIPERGVPPFASPAETNLPPRAASGRSRRTTPHRRSTPRIQRHPSSRRVGQSTTRSPRDRAHARAIPCPHQLDPCDRTGEAERARRSSAIKTSECASPYRRRAAPTRVRRRRVAGHRDLCAGRLRDSTGRRPLVLKARQMCAKARDARWLSRRCRDWRLTMECV